MFYYYKYNTDTGTRKVETPMLSSKRPLHNILPEAYEVHKALP